MPSSDSGNVFLTWENLAFAMPLLATIGIYWFFKLFPLPVALGILFAVLVAYQIRVQIIAQRNKKLEQMDDKTIQELLAEEEKNSNNSQSAQQQQQKKKAMNKVQARLAQERKQAARKAGTKGNAAADEDDFDDADLSAFVKKKT